jgi:Cysteine-rich CWC
VCTGSKRRRPYTRRMQPPPDTSTSVDPTRCPLCGQPNACASEVERATGVPQPPCWCVTARFTPELLRQVPAAAQGKACICRACGAAALQATG